MWQLLLSLSRVNNFEDPDEEGTLLPDDAAALDYACRIVRELRANDGYDDPRMAVRVQNVDGRWCSQYPFLLPAPEIVCSFLPSLSTIAAVRTS